MRPRPGGPPASSGGGSGQPPAASWKRPLRIRDVDGKAWIVSARTSIGTRALIARTHSWIAADASGQAIAAPTRVLERAVDQDRDVAERRLDAVAARRRREVGDELEAVEARGCRLVRGQADRRRLGIHVRRPGQGSIVRRDVVPECHPDRHLALVVGLVRVELRTGRVADHPEAVREPEPPVARERRPTAGSHAVRFEAEVVEVQVAPDREQDGVARGGRAVREIDEVGAVRPGVRPSRGRPRR